MVLKQLEMLVYEVMALLALIGLKLLPGCCFAVAINASKECLVMKKRHISSSLLLGNIKNMVEKSAYRLSCQ
jgi:hypothetical protein